MPPSEKAWTAAEMRARAEACEWCPWLTYLAPCACERRNTTPTIAHLRASGYRWCALNPETVLSLLAEHRALVARWEALKAWADTWGNDDIRIEMARIERDRT
jgi:hypothetical protein